MKTHKCILWQTVNKRMKCNSSGFPSSVKEKPIFWVIINIPTCNAFIFSGIEHRLFCNVFNFPGIYHRWNYLNVFSFQAWTIVRLKFTGMKHHFIDFNTFIVSGTEHHWIDCKAFDFFSMEHLWIDYKPSKLLKVHHY